MAKEKAPPAHARGLEFMVEPEEAITGVARSVECYNNNGMFRNFRILTIFMENGIVKRVERSDPYASWEAISRLEMVNQSSVISLNMNWKDGEVMKK